MNSHNQSAAIVLNWKDASNTVACVSSLVETAEFEVIVIVHNEQLFELDLADTKSSNKPSIVQICLPENRGFSAGVNAGIQEALVRNMSSLLIINNDARIDGTNVKILKAKLEKAGVGAVAPVVLNTDGTIQTTGASLSHRWLSINENSDGASVDYLTFACVFVAAHTFRTVGLLDERFFMYWEDVDFGLRVKEAGLDLIIARNAVATHQLSASRKLAGNRLDLYSAFGLGVFAVKWPRFRKAAHIRALFRIAKRLSLGKIMDARELYLSFTSGKKLHSPSFPTVTHVDWPRSEAFKLAIDQSTTASHPHRN